MSRTQTTYYDTLHNGLISGDDMSTKTKTIAEPYCEPWNAGLCSEPPAVAKRIAALMNAMDGLGCGIIRGEMESELREMKYNLGRRLRAEGWVLRVDQERDVWRVTAPSAKSLRGCGCGHLSAQHASEYPMAPGRTCFKCECSDFVAVKAARS